MGPSHRFAWMHEWAFLVAWMRENRKKNAWMRELKKTCVNVKNDFSIAWMRESALFFAWTRNIEFQSNHNRICKFWYYSIDFQLRSTIWWQSNFNLSITTPKAMKSVRTSDLCPKPGLRWAAPLPDVNNLTIFTKLMVRLEIGHWLSIDSWQFHWFVECGIQLSYA